MAIDPEDTKHEDHEKYELEKAQEEAADEREQEGGYQ